MPITREERTDICDARENDVDFTQFTNVTEQRFYVLCVDGKFIREIDEWDYINGPANDIPITEYQSKVAELLLVDNIAESAKFYHCKSNTWIILKYTPDLHESQHDEFPWKFMTIGEIREYYCKLLGRDVHVIPVVKTTTIKYFEDDTNFFKR